MFHFGVPDSSIIPPPGGTYNYNNISSPQCSSPLIRNERIPPNIHLAQQIHDGNFRGNNGYFQFQQDSCRPPPFPHRHQYQSSLPIVNEFSLPPTQMMLAQHRSDEYAENRSFLPGNCIPGTGARQQGFMSPPPRFQYDQNQNSPPFRYEQNQNSPPFRYEQNQNSPPFQYDQNQNSPPFRYEQNQNSPPFRYEQNQNSPPFEYDKNRNSPPFQYDQNQNSSPFQDHQSNLFQYDRNSPPTFGNRIPSLFESNERNNIFQTDLAQQIPNRGFLSFDSPRPLLSLQFPHNNGRQLELDNSPQPLLQLDSDAVPYNARLTPILRSRFNARSAGRNMNNLSRIMKAKGPNRQRRKTSPSIVSSDLVNIVQHWKPRPPTPELPLKLYHYTNEEGKEGILNDMYLRPKPVFFSGAGSSSRFGKGIYFTDLPPDTPTIDILKNNYGSHRIFFSQGTRTQFCFEFNTNDLHDLEYVEDESCFYSHKNERRRYIWMFNSPKLHIAGSQGYFYERIFDKYEKKPNEIRKNEWNFLKENPKVD